MKLSGIKYLADQGVENIWKNKMMAFATFCVLQISLLLVGISVLFYFNMNSMIQGLNNQNEIAVIMNEDATDETVKKVEETIRAMDNVHNVVVHSKDEILENTLESVPDSKPIADRYITDSDFMPVGMSVTVTDNNRIAETSDEISALEGVQYARFYYQIAEFLRELRRVVSLIAGAIIIALAFVSMIMISNTTKTSVYARREEIQIMKYVGATNSFIRMPFFVEGMITGFFAGAAAFFITWLTYSSAYKVLMQQQYFMMAFGAGSLIPFGKIRIFVLLAYIVAGAFIGALGSVISTRKHIDV